MGYEVSVWFWFLIIFIAIFLFVPSDSEYDPNNETTKGEITQPEKTKFYISDEVECSNWKIRVESVVAKDYSTENSEFTNFYITFYATNIGKKDDDFYARYITLSKDDIKYSHVEYLFSDYFDGSRLCRPFIEQKFIMVFETPKGSDPEDFILNVKFIINSCSIVLQEKPSN